jgi:hypothetical protein
MTMTDPEPGDVWQNVLDLQAAMDRLRAEHGPFLRALRCDATVLQYLTLKLQPNKREPGDPPPLHGIPVIEDDDVPARYLRRVYDDGTTEDAEVLSEALEAVLRDLPETLKFKPPPWDGFAAYYRSGFVTRSTNYSPLRAPDV